MKQSLLPVAMNTWYKKSILLGGGLFVFSVFLEFGFLSSFTLSFFAIGLFLVGLGEFVNHKNMFSQKLVYGPMPSKTIIRKPEETGLLLDVVGLFCFVMAFYYMFYGFSY